MQFGDIDNDGITAIYDEKKSGNGIKRVFYLSIAPVRKIIDVFVNDKMLNPKEYKTNSDLGYISLKEPPPPGENNISISYLYSKDLDLLVSNWDNDKGNYIFYNNSSDNAPPYVKDHHPPQTFCRRFSRRRYIFYNYR